MRKIRIICVLILLATLLTALPACSESTVTDGGDRTDESWDKVDFKGQTVRIAISVNQCSECSFPAADIYTKGPDEAGTNEVTKEARARNAKAESELGIKIEYAEKDLPFYGVLEDIRGIVQTAAKNSPDVYNNDMYGLCRAMVDGLLWNVKDPGEDVKSYFDFTTKGWYNEFMKGCTFDQNKVYTFAGDYFIDMIRMAWVLYVNHDIFESSIKKMPNWCTSVDDFYDYVESGYWDLDILCDMVKRVHVDGGTFSVTECEDPVVGLAYNHGSDWIVSASSQVTLYYQDKENGYRPTVMDSIDTFQKVANKYVELMNTPGALYDSIAITSTLHFLHGNALFAFSRLGEMESKEMRDFPAAKGLVPVPKWDVDEQEEYHTVVSDQVELGCILNSSQAFSAASALMQHLNENSLTLVHAYYEKGLKYKYNDDENARVMMDIVRETTDSPFGMQIGALCESLYTGVGSLKGLKFLKENVNTCASTFASEKDAYRDCMQQMIEKFAALQ